MPARDLPARPHRDQLRHQARDLLRAFRRSDPSAVADFRDYHPKSIDPGQVRLADAQLVLARSYRAASWPQLQLVCRVIEATFSDDFETVGALVRAQPQLLRDKATERGWSVPLASAADLALRRVVTMLQSRGAMSVSAAMARPELRGSLDTLRLLGRLGARAPRDAVGGAVETLNGSDLAFMMEVGADIGGDSDWRSLLALALETYARDAVGKHRVLEVIAAHGVALPDTAPMGVHRGRVDLLARHFDRDPALLSRTFTHQEIYPPELGCHADESLALHGAPLAGATLLHMAADYEDVDTVRWLLDRGMDVNVRAAVDARGFGGHTPLFSCVVTYNAGRSEAAVARLLLDRGADPNVRASIRKGLAFARDPSVHEYRDVTALGWGRRFHDKGYVSGAAMRLIAEHGGVE